jgi:integrase
MPGYWSLNDYHRLSVKDFVEQFCGWKALLELVNCAKSSRDRAFLAALFLTGGRVKEVLSLTAQNFEIRESENLIICRNMLLEKRYRKVEAITKPNGKKGWLTERLEKYRKPFPIVMREPLVPILLEWLSQSQGGGLLFPSPYSVGPLSRFWAYRLVRKIDIEIPTALREALGLNKPFIKDGVKVSDSIHLWLHWFRSQRASQLVENYGYSTEDLIEYFSWESPQTAMVYARRGWRGLASKMMVQVAYT